MRPHWSLYTAAAGALIGAALYHSAPADADPTRQQIINYAASAAPAICATLNDYPTLTGVVGVLRGVMQDTGFSVSDTGAVVVLAVENQCPQFIPLLQRFADTYSRSGAVAV